MNSYGEFILAVFLLTNLLLVTSSRLYHCIKIVATQGLLLGVLPLAMWNYEAAIPGWDIYLVAVINVMLKGVMIPGFLVLAMRKAQVKRELEPLVGYAMSLMIVLALTAAAFVLCRTLNLADGGSSIGVSPFATPIAFATMLTGLFMIVARRKAITQVIGFLTFENGIAIFGTGFMLEHGLIIELGILLDVFVLVFIMGIALFRISSQFEHIDTDKLNRLGDYMSSEEQIGASGKGNGNL